MYSRSICLQEGGEGGQLLSGMATLTFTEYQERGVQTSYRCSKIFLLYILIFILVVKGKSILVLLSTFFFNGKIIFPFPSVLFPCEIILS